MASVKLPSTLLLTGHQVSSLYLVGAFFSTYFYKITPALLREQGVRLLTGQQAPIQH